MPAASDDRLTRALKLTALALLGLALLYVALLFLAKILAVVVVVVGATFLAYLLYPPIQWLQRRRFPRWLAIGSVFLVLILVIGGICAFVGPRITYEAKSLAHDFPTFVSQARDAIINTHTSFLAAVPIESRETAANFFNQLVVEVQKLAASVAGTAITLLLNVAAVVTGIIVVPFLAFYILLDLDRLRNGVTMMFPARHKAQIFSILHDVDVVVGGFIRGQVIVAVVVGVLVTIWLSILRVKFALLIGLFAGVADIIPYVGAVAGAVVGVATALLNQGFFWALLVLAGFIVIYEFEGHVVAPFVVGQRVGLPPLMIIIAVLAGAELGGIAGMFVAVPVAAIVKVLWMRFMRPSVITEPSAEPTPVPTVVRTTEAPQPQVIVAKD